MLVALGEDPGVVMDEMGHADPTLTLSIYRQGIRREPGEKDALRDNPTHRQEEDDVREAA